MSALGDLFDKVAAEFAADQSTTTLVFGFREKAKQLNQGIGRANRIVFEPMTDGLIGVDSPPRGTSAGVYHTSDFLQAATIYIWAYDGNAPSSERAQYEAVDALRMRLRVALQKSAAGFLTIGKYKRMSTALELSFGMEWALDIAVRELDLDILHAAVPVIVTPSSTIEIQLPGPSTP